MGLTLFVFLGSRYRTATLEIQAPAMQIAAVAISRAIAGAVGSEYSLQVLKTAINATAPTVVRISPVDRKNILRSNGIIWMRPHQQFPQ